MSVLAAAPPEIAGEWQGKLAVNASTSLTVRFTFTRGANGAYTAVLNSPDNAAVKDTPVSGVTWDGANLKLTVPTLQGSYAGKLANGKITGQWTQPGGALPLELAPYAKPVVSAAAVRSLTGPWKGVVTVPGAGELTMTFEFKQGADGALGGTFGIPDQGLTSTPLSDVVLENGQLTAKALQGRIEYKGRLNGERLVGKIKVPSPTAPPDGIDLSLQRGQYAAQVQPVALKLDASAFAALKGRWQGKGSFTNPQNNQKIEFAVTLRFEAGSKAGEYFGYVDSSSPQGTSNGVVMSEATLAGGKLTAKFAQGQAEYNGTLAGTKITGEMAQGGMRIPLELTKAP